MLTEMCPEESKRDCALIGKRVRAARKAKKVKQVFYICRPCSMMRSSKPMMTIFAVSFLANTSNKPIALIIIQFEAQVRMEAGAVVSLLILLINLVVKSVLEKRKA